MSLTATPQQLYALGGQELSPSSAVVPTVEDFDPATQTWVSTTPLATGRHSPGVATLEGTLYVLGGTNAAGVPLTVVEAGRVQGSPRPPRLTLTLTGCTRCRAGDTFSVSATVTNPAAHAVRVEVKAGVVFPDGTEVNAWRVRDKHFTAELAPGLDVTVELLREPIPTGLPAGLWHYEGALLSSELGRTLARDVRAFTLE